jgi:hypothetical protein
MREISNYKLQIPNKLQKANYKYLVIEICDLPFKNIKPLTYKLSLTAMGPAFQPELSDFFDPPPADPPLENSALCRRE